MAGKILDNGTLLALGLVGVVAAVGAANKAGLYGSRAKSWESYTRDEEASQPPETTCYHCHTPNSVPEYAKEGTPGWEGFCSWTCKEAEERARKQRHAKEAAWRQSHRGSRATLDERVADLQFDMTTLFGARETKRPSELKRMRDRVLTENADLLHRIQEQKARGIDTRLLERDLLARIR